MKRRILSLVLSLMFIIGLFPTMIASAEEPLTPTVSEAPMPMEWGLGYNGYEQELIDDSNCAVEGGTLMYRIGTDGTWSYEIPKAKNAGTYEIHWMVEGADGYADHICEEPIEVTIEKAILDVTATSYFRQRGESVPDLNAPEAYVIQGFVGEDTAENVEISGKPVLSYDSTPNMKDETFYFIYIDVDGMSSDNYEFNGMFGTLYVKRCVHNFVDFTLGTANTTNDSIFARCTKGCRDFKRSAPVITLCAPDEAVYDGFTWHTASSISHDYQIELGEISYDSSIVDAGNCTASVTYEGVTASVSYTIAKRTLTIKANHATCEAGDNNPTLTYTVIGWDENHDEEFDHRVTGISAVCDGDLSQIGSYPITFSGTPVVTDYEGEDVSENYIIKTQNGTLTVTEPTHKHQWGKWQISAPTYENDGFRERSCETCNEVDKEILSKLENTFEDISDTLYYALPVDWAVQNGITNGVSATTFVPNAYCTRAQIVTFLWRAAGEPNPTDTENPFVDVTSDDYFYEAVLWAVENGITNGVSDDIFAPNASCSRAQIVTFLWRAQGEPAPANTNPFHDVSVEDYFCNAVVWAMENGITNGSDGTTFSPKSSCTRAQSVTFLYRALA